jgi:MOSC domain-containing protein YiiM
VLTPGEARPGDPVRVIPATTPETDSEA